MTTVTSSTNLARIFHTGWRGDSRQALVAQVSNRLYRRLPVGRVFAPAATWRRPAGWKPAIQQVGSLRYVRHSDQRYEISGLALSLVSKAIAVAAAALSLVLAGPAIGSTNLSTQPREDFWITDGHVNAVIESDGIIYVGGRFNFLRPNRGTGIALNLATQNPDLQFPQVNGVVLAAVSDGSGGFFLGGEFNEVGGLSRANLAYIRPDHTVDPNWNPGTDGRIEALALTGRTLYAAGVFTTIGGQPCDGLAALDAFGGKPTGWTPEVTPKGTVTELATYRGHAIAAGNFASIGGTQRNGLAMIDRENATATAWDPNPQGGDVRAMALKADTVYLGGTFTSIGGASRRHLAAVDAITGEATAWNPAEPGESEIVEALAVSGKTVFVGGNFTFLGGNQSSGLTALDAASGNAVPWKPSPAGDGPVIVRHIAVAENRVHVSGTFTEIGGAARNGVAVLDQLTGEALPWTLEFSGAVSALAISSQTAYAGGVVPNTAGQPRSNLAAIDAATGQPTAWNPQVNGEVHALAIGTDWLFAGGQFSSVGGLTRSNLAAIDRVSGGPVSNWGPALSGTVRALGVSPDNEVFVGGDFTSVNGQTRNHLASIFPNGSLSQWDPNVSGPVHTLALSGNSIYLGGAFQSVSALPRANLAEISLNGQPTAWNPSANGTVESLALGSTAIVAGGAFTHIGGQFRNRLALLNAASGGAESWNPNASGRVRALAVRGNTVYAGGDFLAMGGQPRSRLAAIDATTAAVATWNPAASDTVNALAVTASGVFAGGTFTHINESMRPGFAAFGEQGLPVIVTPPTNQMLFPGADLNLSVAATGDAPLSYQWQINGNDLPGATSPSLTIPDVQPADAGTYAVIVSNHLGRARSGDAVLTVLVPPLIDAHPVGLTNEPGANIVLNVVATGSPAPNFSWRLNGVPIPGGIGPTLTIPNAQPTDSGSYSVVISSAAGAVRSETAHVMVSAPTFQFADDLANSPLVSLDEGQFIGNNSKATSEEGEPDHGGIQGGKSVWMAWRPQGVGVAEFHTLGSGFDTVLAVYTNGQNGLERLASDDDRGGFRTSRVLFNVEDGVSYFIAIDGFDAASGNFLLTWQLMNNVPPLPTILFDPTCQVASEGSTVEFAVQAIGPGELSYQWYFGPHRLPEETNPVLTLRNVRPEDVGSYWVRVGNGDSLIAESLPAALQLAAPIVFDPNQKVTEKFYYISGPPPSFGVAPGSAQRVDFSNTEAEPSQTDPLPCQTVVWSTMIWPFNVSGPGAMMIDTEGSEIRTVMSVTTGDAPPMHTEVACAVDGSIKFFPVPGTNYLLFVDGLHGARGRIQVNIRFCGPPELSVLPSPTLNPFTSSGGRSTLAVEVTDNPCETLFQWYRDGVAIPGATSAIFDTDTPSTIGGTYSVVATNCAGAVSNVVATFLRLWIETSDPLSGTEHRLRAAPLLPMRYVVQETMDYSHWDNFHTNPAGTELNLRVNSPATAPSARHFRVWPEP